jgi:hypothetical protein
MMCRVLALKMASKRPSGQLSRILKASGAGVLGCAASFSQALIPGRLFGAIRGLPDQMRQALGEEDGVLAGAAADFQYLTAIMEMITQHFKNGFAVFCAGRGVGLFHAHLSEG